MSVNNDIKPVYKRVNSEWVKRTAYERINGEWVKISENINNKFITADGLTFVTVDGYVFIVTEVIL